MPRKKGRITDHDYSTNLYIAQIEACYRCDIELLLDARGRGSDTQELTCEIQATFDTPGVKQPPLTLARGPVSTASNARFNSNVRYLLTVGVLRLMEAFAEKK